MQESLLDFHMARPGFSFSVTSLLTKQVKSHELAACVT